MRSVILIGASLLSLLCGRQSWGQAQEDWPFTSTMLRGMRTAVIFYKEVDTPKCSFTHGIEKKLAPAIGVLQSRGLKFIALAPGSPPPDASILLMLEASDSKIESGQANCNVFVKLEVFHQMVGTLRYSGATPVLRALAYRTIQVDSVPVIRLTDLIQDLALNAISAFIDAYMLANKPWESHPPPADQSRNVPGTDILAKGGE